MAILNGSVKELQDRLDEVVQSVVTTPPTQAELDATKAQLAQALESITELGVKVGDLSASVVIIQRELAKNAPTERALTQATPKRKIPSPKPMMASGMSTS